jgi:hypothetical protein
LLSRVHPERRYYVTVLLSNSGISFEEAFATRGIQLISIARYLILRKVAVEVEKDRFVGI